MIVYLGGSSSNWLCLKITFREDNRTAPLVKECGPDGCPLSDRMRVLETRDLRRQRNGGRRYMIRENLKKGASP